MKKENSNRKQFNKSNFKSPKTDPDGSWTGVPSNETEKPVQDADDL